MNVNRGEAFEAGLRAIEEAMRDKNEKIGVLSKDKI
jgi:hypothetical protein